MSNILDLTLRCSLAAASFWILTDLPIRPVQAAWGHILASTYPGGSYDSVGGHLVTHEFEGGVIPYQIKPQCTYLNVAVVVWLMVIPRLEWRRGQWWLAALVLLMSSVFLVGAVNLLRLTLLRVMDDAGYAWFASHDIPNLAAGFALIASALYYRVVASRRRPDSYPRHAIPA